MRHAQGLSDLAHVSGEVGPVLGHARSTDYFQVGDLDQVSEDFVLHAIGEERVFLVGTQVFEWQDCDTFVGDSPGGSNQTRGRAFLSLCRSIQDYSCDYFAPQQESE